MSKQKKNMGSFDTRFKPYHVAAKALTLTIGPIGIEEIPDLFPKAPTVAHLLTELKEGEQSPYVKTEAKPKTNPMPVLWFRETGSRMSLVLNTTNRRTLIEAYGMDPNDWTDRKITLSYGLTKQKKPTVIVTAGGQPKAENVDTKTGEIQSEPADLSELM